MSELIDYYSKHWSLNKVEKITETYTGYIYKVDSEYGPAVLKIFTEVGVKDEAGGSVFLRACSGNGSVSLYEYDEKAQLMEYLSGQNLYEYSKNGREDEATLVFVNIIKKNHKAQVIEDREKLTTLVDLFRLFDRLNPPENLNSTFKKAKVLSKYLLSTQTEEVLLHGDLHHENVLKNKSYRLQTHQLYPP